MITSIKKNKSAGFTLIELLVVVSIIGFLSSVVFASLSSARSKAKNSALKEGVSQFVNLLTLNYDDYGSYTQLQPGWITNTAGTKCSDVTFSGIYANKAREICSYIENNTTGTNVYPGALYKMYILPNANNYSIMVYLNNDKWFCSGSSGARGEYSAASWPGSSPGCNNNP